LDRLGGDRQGGGEHDRERDADRHARIVMLSRQDRIRRQGTVRSVGWYYKCLIFSDLRRWMGPGGRYGTCVTVHRLKEQHVS
jgi:hypothetical protein